MIANSMKYHQSGTNPIVEKSDEHDKYIYKHGECTLRVYTHKASMNVRFFLQCSPSLLNDLRPKIKECMDEGSYGINFHTGYPYMKQKTLPVIVANDNLMIGLD